ncbi:MAG TPA: GNAT family N-acetyltransferase [Candidatus Blautia pullistercoris]|uniref:GNAT family N-acetyltransferase n=1 Tax=Candidatus Blautia pullistercoris TaxID=2838499 RepID=A0A9D1VP94_9FIRM|nr:GNAT family N-acetyltransferase [Clostridiales bacterium]HIX39046.1 GNAT family N-acetyltransferase [Candidatus Blautia pullistercoris]
MMPYYNMRKNNTCDSVFLESFIWKEFYNVRYAIWEDKALLWLMEYNGKCFSAMPLCKEEDLPGAFGAIQQYFNEELGYPLVINLADEYAVKYLNLPEEKYFVKEQEDSRDYLYLGESLRKLSGKKLHKKKNRLNVFLRQYEGRFEYRTLGCDDKDDMWKFLDRWRIQKGEDQEEHLDYEVRGIHDILRNCCELNIHMGGIYVDGRLEAFSVGSYNKIEDMAVIHIEKANPEIPGLYQAINQMFLLNEFPNVQWVNREDDMGLEGLRKAKMSYNPADFARKYLVEQLLDGQKSYKWAEEIENTASENLPEYLPQEEKKETIPLWKACFPEDTDRYLDYYYQEKAKDNRILAKKEDGKIITMLHRNPYKIHMRDKLWEADYIVAVATEENHRGRGHMREVLTKALRDMNLEGRPFTFLMPAAEAIYLPFDFRFVWKKPRLVLKRQAEETLEKVPVSGEADWEKAGQFMEKWLAERSQIYTFRDTAYVRRLLRELESEDGELYFLKGEGEEPLGLQGLTGREKKDQALLYAREGLFEEKEGKTGIMARITALREFLPAFSLNVPESLTLNLEVEDKLIPENEGSFFWSLDEQGSSVELSQNDREMQAAQRIWTLKTDIGDLASWLFGYEKPEELWPDMPEEMKKELEKIQTVHGIWLDEIV